jgi:hypothetical protein
MKKSQIHISPSLFYSKPKLWGNKTRLLTPYLAFAGSGGRKAPVFWPHFEEDVERMVEWSPLMSQISGHSA